MQDDALVVGGPCLNAVSGQLRTLLVSGDQSKTAKHNRSRHESRLTEMQKHRFLRMLGVFAKFRSGVGAGMAVLKQPCKVVGNALDVAFPFLDSAPRISALLESFHGHTFQRTSLPRPAAGRQFRGQSELLTCGCRCLRQAGWLFPKGLSGWD